MVCNQKTGRMERLESVGDFYRFLPDLQREVSLEFFSIANLDSTDITPDHWVQIAEKIREHYDSFEGFVVVHGTNTMSYTAAALSFALQNLRKPVVLTGSLLPINDIGSDGRMNLVFAIRAALLDIAEVCIALGPRVLRGCRAKKTEQSIVQTFDSPRFPALAYFDTSVHLHPWRMVRRKRNLVCKADFDTNVTTITLHPGMPESVLHAILDAKPHGIVLRAYGLGMLPEQLFPWLRVVEKEEIPLLITSQLVRGTIDLHRYRKQVTLEKLGVISGKDMTLECAVVKLMWVLKQTKNAKRRRELLEKSLVGELDE